MIKTLLAQVKEYKKQSLLSPLFAALEVFFDVSIPFVISLLVDKGIQAGNMQHVILPRCKMKCNKKDMLI